MRWTREEWEAKSRDLAALYERDHDIAAWQLRQHRHFMEVSGFEFNLVSAHTVLFGLKGGEMGTAYRSGQNLRMQRPNLAECGFVEFWPDQAEFEGYWNRYLELCRKAGNKGPSGGAKKPPRERTFFSLRLNDYPPVSPTELETLPPRYEGAERQVTRNIRERDPKARRDAEAFYRNKDGGHLICQGCEIDFGQTYGPRGEGFMHFHHVAPLAKAGGKREVVGAVDLVPLCPNCHAIIHRGEDPLTVIDLVALIQASRN